jgi:hypothetical protein
MSIASRIEQMEQHIGNAYDKIEDLGIDLTNVDKNIDNIATMLENVWNEYPKVTASDVEEATLNGTKKGRMEIDLKGNTYQEQLTGKNLANYFESYIQPGDEPRGSIQITNNGFSYNITQNLGTGMGVLLPIDLKSGETYFLKFITTTGVKVANIHLQQSTDSSSYQNITNNSSFTCNDDFKYLRLYISNEKNSGTNIGTISNIMINNGSTAEDFEPYCGRNPSTKSIL